jgi:hypothetical protein
VCWEAELNTSRATRNVDLDQGAPIFEFKGAPPAVCTDVNILNLADGKPVEPWNIHRPIAETSVNSDGPL